MFETLIAASAIATLAVTGVGIVVALKGVRDQLWLQMFSDYTRRYHEIVRDLPSESRDPEGTFDFESLDGAKRGDILNAVRGYLNLCSEEYYLYRRGRIEKKLGESGGMGSKKGKRRMPALPPGFPGIN